MVSHASRLSVNIERIAASKSLSRATPRFSAVAMTPVPISFVSTRTSPIRAPAILLDTIRVNGPATE